MSKYMFSIFLLLSCPIYSQADSTIVEQEYSNLSNSADSIVNLIGSQKKWKDEVVLIKKILSSKDSLFLISVTENSDLKRKIWYQDSIHRKDSIQLINFVISRDSALYEDFNNLVQLIYRDFSLNKAMEYVEAIKIETNVTPDRLYAINTKLPVLNTLLVEYSTRKKDAQIINQVIINSKLRSIVDNEFLDRFKYNGTVTVSDSESEELETMFLNKVQIIRYNQVLSLIKK